MNHVFLTDDQISSLPKNSEEAWAKVVEQVATYVEGKIGPNTKVEDDEFLRSHATTFVETIAGRFGIDISQAKSIESLSDRFRALQLKAAGIMYEVLANKISAAVKVVAEEDDRPILLSGSGLVRLYQLSRQLREEVMLLAIDEKQTRKLLSLLDDFDKGLEGRNASGTKLLTILAVVAAGIAGVTSTLADGPAAIETIGKIAAALGDEIESGSELKRISAEKELLRLPAPDPSDNQK